MIKKLIIVLSLIAINLSSAQEKEAKPSVENNLLGANIGFVEGKLHYETKLTRLSTLRVEAGVDLLSYTYTHFDGNILKEKTESLLSPSIAVEPLFYYNLDRRSRLGKNINKNTGNYFSIKTSFMFNESELYNSNKNRKVSNSFIITPKYGFKRSFAEQFFYELGIGIGWQHNTGDTKDKDEVFIDLSARIGLNF